MISKENLLKKENFALRMTLQNILIENQKARLHLPVNIQNFYNQLDQDYIQEIYNAYRGGSGLTGWRPPKVGVGGSN